MNVPTTPHHTSQLTQTLLKPVVKECLGFESLSYFQANKLACHNFMDAGRRHEMLWLETKGSLLLTVITVARTSAFLYQFPEPQFPQGDATRAR